MSDEILRLIERSGLLTDTSLEAFRARRADDEAIRRAIERVQAYDSEHQRAIQDAKARAHYIGQALQVISAQVNLWGTTNTTAYQMSGGHVLSQLTLYTGRDIERWKSLAHLVGRQPSFSYLLVAAMAYEYSLAAVTARIADIELLDQNPSVAAMVLRPYEETLLAGVGMADELSRARSTHKRDALSAALALTADLVRSSAIEIVESDSPIAIDVGLSLPSVVNTPKVIRRELVAAKEIPASQDLATLRQCSPASQFADGAQRVATLLGDCNEEWELWQNRQIFRITTAVYVAGVGLPFISVVNRQTLGSFVDSLYLMLYEAAGGEHLRYLEADLATREECQVVWAIKALRNFHLRHDPDHGASGDVKRKREKLQGTLTYVGLAGYPRSTDDFRLIHHRLLAEVEAFLELLLSRLRGRARA